MENPPSAACHIVHRGPRVELFVDACRHDPQVVTFSAGEELVHGVVREGQLPTAWVIVRAGAAEPGAAGAGAAATVIRQETRGELGATSRTTLGFRHAPCMSGVAALGCKDLCNL